MDVGVGQAHYPHPCCWGWAALIPPASLDAPHTSHGAWCVGRPGRRGVLKRPTPSNRDGDNEPVQRRRPCLHIRAEGGGGWMGETLRIFSTPPPCGINPPNGPVLWVPHPCCKPMGGGGGVGGGELSCTPHPIFFRGSPLGGIGSPSRLELRMSLSNTMCRKFVFIQLPCSMAALYCRIGGR